MMKPISRYWPPIDGCETCEMYGECVCWTDADQKEFEREWGVKDDRQIWKDRCSRLVTQGRALA